MSVRLVLGARIAAARRLRNITQAELAGALSVGANQVSRWERGEAMPATRLLPDLADALGIDRDELYIIAIESSMDEIAAAQKERDAVFEQLKEMMPLVRRLLEREAAAADEREEAANH